MITIGSGNATALVVLEHVKANLTFYVPECCSRRYLSLKGLGSSHADGCPVDRAIRELLDLGGESRGC